MPRFVVLHHETPIGYEHDTHFDLMFETNGVLLTWAAAELPENGTLVAAERLADHRLAYLEYEGSISGGRGSVRRVDGGDFEWIEQQPARLVALVRGEKLRGRLVIEEVEAEAQRWRVALSD